MTAVSLGALVSGARCSSFGGRIGEGQDQSFGGASTRSGVVGDQRNH